MKNVNRILLRLGILVIIVNLFSSCSTELAVASRFVRNTVQEKPGVWFIGANHLFMTCKIEEGDEEGYNCQLLESQNDSVLLEMYNRAFAKQLEEIGYKIYTFDESEQFFAHKGLSLIVNIAQLEMEEYIEVYSDSEIFDTLKYIESFPVRVLALNSWIEVSLVDTTTSKREMFYATTRISDLIDGYFTQNEFKGNVTYNYKRYDMLPGAVVRMVPDAGSDHSGRLFDVWMNRYIMKNAVVQDGVGYYPSVKKYYHYNAKKGRIEESDPSRALQEL
ncbi:MAG: hypothetical protein R6V49_10465 [Bacteroidales bacterium]